MCMFVGVNMRDFKARALKFADLSGGFGLKFLRIDPSGCCSYCEAGQTLGEAAASRGDKSANLTFGERRAAIHQHHMTAHSEVRL